MFLTGIRVPPRPTDAHRAGGTQQPQHPPGRRGRL